MMGIGINFRMMRSVVITEQHLSGGVPIMKPVFINR